MGHAHDQLLSALLALLLLQGDPQPGQIDPVQQHQRQPQSQHQQRPRRQHGDQDHGDVRAGQLFFDGHGQTSFDDLNHGHYNTSGPPGLNKT